MNTRKRIRTVLTLAAVAMAVFAGPAQAGPLEGELGILTPGTLAGNNPATGAPWEVGDQYRFAFHTSATITATSADIATYNMWVQGLADASTLNIGADDGVTWKAIGSTSEVDARDNTSTNPTVESGHAIFLLDGSTLIANDYPDLWDGSIQNPIGITELGTAWMYWPWTGSGTDGTAATGTGGSGNPLGSTGEVGQGNASVTTDWIWRVWTMDPPGTELPMYALSDPLVIVGETDPTLPDVDGGRDVITWSGEPVTLDPNVVNNSDPVTALTYLWSADPATGVVFSATDVEAPTVTITKTVGDAVTVTLTLAVNNVGSGKDDVTDTMTIDVYDDSCLAAKAVGPVVLDPTDIDGNCITNFADFAVMATTWLDDYALTAPEPE